MRLKTFGDASASRWDSECDPQRVAGAVGDLEGFSVKTLVAQNQFGGDKLVGKPREKTRLP